MGLDMYLEKDTYIGNQYRKKAKLVKVSVPKNQKGVTFPVDDIKNERISNITEQIGYWRKANAIHKWFVDNVQHGVDDCKRHYVDKAQLKELLDICKKVIKASILVKGKIQNGSTMTKKGWKPIIEDGRYIKNSRIAQKLLPTTEGYFFGGIGYDEYYLRDIKETKVIITNALKEKGDIHYQSSW